MSNLRNYIKSAYLNINVSNNYSKFIFKIFKTKIIRITTGKKGHKLSLYINDNNTIDVDKMTSTFSSIYIHSADAWIVYEFINTIREINKKISDFGISIGYYTNHDNYGINLEYAPFLRCIIKACYINLNNLDYIEVLNVPENEVLIKKIKLKSSLLITNNHFIK